ncbi:MAG: aldo/keto reductase [Lachnospiraceae bacterium]|nr:aldo/keto reductase [Lachnospiraceae bacterium]
MKTVDYGCGVDASAVVLGCMRIAQMEKKKLAELINIALDCGVNTFDHADIYGGGKSEELFGQVLAETPSLREKLFIQSKCGIRSEMYDFSKEHILNSVDGILKRLNTDYLDLLILHRPDILMDANEVAEAFDRLAAQGKVRRFGVSNMNPMQIALLQSAQKEKLAVNQLQLSLAHTFILDEGVNVNMPDTSGMVSSGSVLDYCRLNEIGIQSWSSLQYGFFEGTFLGNEKYPELNRQLDLLAEKYEAAPGAIAIAWILRIPGVNQAVIGTTKTDRVRELAEASEIKLTGKEWYELYLSAGNRLP